MRLKAFITVMLMATVAVACGTGSQAQVATAGGEAVPSVVMLAETPDEDTTAAEAEAAIVERAMNAAIPPALDRGECRLAKEAKAKAEAVLADLAIPGWTVAIHGVVKAKDCTALTIGADDREIGITTALHPDVRATLDAFLERSLSECFDQETAEAELTAALNAIGMTDFIIRQNGPMAGPGDRMKEIQAHVDAGCVIYTLPGWTEDGTPIYALHGG